MKLIFAASAAMLLAGSAHAQLNASSLNSLSLAPTYSDTFTFTNVFDGTKVAGVISGIQNGTNQNPAALSVSVTMSEYSNALGIYTGDANASEGPNNFYSADDGVITSISTRFIDELARTQLTLSSGVSGGSSSLSTQSRVEVATGNPQFALVSTSIAPIMAAVPEPGTWAMMIVGFGLVGFAMRRRQSVATRVSYAG